MTAAGSVGILLFLAGIASAVGGGCRVDSRGGRPALRCRRADSGEIRVALLASRLELEAVELDACDLRVIPDNLLSGVNVSSVSGRESFVRLNVAPFCL